MMNLHLELVGIGTAFDEERHSDLACAAFGLASLTSTPDLVLHSYKSVAGKQARTGQVVIHSLTSVDPSTLPAVAGKWPLVVLVFVAVAAGSCELVFVAVAELDSGLAQSCSPAAHASSVAAAAVVAGRAPQRCMLVSVGTAVTLAAGSGPDQKAFVFAAAESAHSAACNQLAVARRNPARSSSSSDTVAGIFGLEWLGCLLALPLLRFAVDRKQTQVAMLVARTNYPRRLLLIPL